MIAIRVIAVSLLAVFLCLPAVAQSRSGEPATSELYRTIAAVDHEFFDAYNRCDLEKFGSYLPDQLEFYHDQGGVLRTRQELLEALKKNICGKVSRELLLNSLEVYPMNGYGALEIGTHLFHHPGRDKVEPVGEGKFVHLWQKQSDGSWKLTRVISFDHHPVDPSKP
jgi:ketosteroid isomerase-like protein